MFLRTCLYYNNLLSFKFNWNMNKSIKLIQTKEKQLSYLTHSINQQQHINHHKLISFNNDSKQLSTLVLSILRKSTINLEIIQLSLPFQQHTQLYSTLSCLNTQLTQLSIQDSTCEHKHAFINVKPCFLIQSQHTLQTLDIPTFPSDQLIQHCQFPKLKSLTIALNHDVNWVQFKHMFPNLTELNFVLDGLSQWTFVKSLLSDASLFPWFKRLSITSDHQSLKQHVSKEELKSSLLQLEGLDRITAGWDIIALS